MDGGRHYGRHESCVADGTVASRERATVSCRGPEPLQTYQAALYTHSYGQEGRTSL